MQKSEQIMALHDLSGLGRSSLAVIIPTISVMGIQVISVPTTILSSHTGGFKDIAVTDLTDMMPDTLKQYGGVGLKPAAIYSGYLGSHRQIDIVRDYFASFRDSLKLVDPVMGDNGKIYSGIDDKLVSKMRDLISVADIITPNITEAFLLLGRPCKELKSIDEYEKLAKDLSHTGAKKVVLKGIKVDNKIINILYDSGDDTYYASQHKYINKSYPGTGDIFASVLLGCIVRGINNNKALKTAGNFLSYVVEYTHKQNTDTKFGIELERCLDWFYKNRVFSEED